MKRYRCIPEEDDCSVMIELLAHSGETALLSAVQINTGKMYRQIQIWDETGLVFVRDLSTFHLSGKEG